MCTQISGLMFIMYPYFILLAYYFVYFIHCLLNVDYGQLID
jgi:hypothetical protein